MRRLSTVVCAFVLASNAACSLDAITDVGDISEGSRIDTEVIESFEGAKFVYNGLILQFREYLAQEALTVARFTDELSLLPNYPQTSLDDRMGRSTTGGVVNYVQSTAPFQKAQTTRVHAEQALQLLKKYGAGKSDEMQAHSYAILGFTHLMLADNYCSGIPLSTSLWGGEFTPSHGYPTDSLYERAVTIFDKGLELEVEKGSTRAMLLVGKARALNSLGKYEEASHAAMDMTPADSTSLYYGSRSTTDGGASHSSFVSSSILDTARYIVKNSKGVNGLIWLADDVASQDTRVRVTTLANGAFATLVRPVYFANDFYLAIAQWSEAKLIEAEYYLSVNDVTGWLNAINEVRSRYKTYSGIPLADTTDPGTEDSRVDLLFRERAYTNYLAGRRLGDLRRLVRQYGRSPETVFPMGISEGRDLTTYASNYVLAPEEPGKGRESTYNGKYNMCDSYAP